jgi:hypothetical protein
MLRRLTPFIAILGSVYPVTLNAQISRTSFREIAPQGFGDRQNSWTWSMEWFNGKLYVGTNRAYFCMMAAITSRITGAGYPPSDPDVQCSADVTQLPLQAEIWSWSPKTNTWTRVLQSPNTAPIPGSANFTALDIGFRGMTIFQEPDGTHALYVGSCSSKQLWPSMPNGRLLRSTDGVNFAPVPQSPGTFLGNLGNACFRGLGSFNGKFYALAGSYQGAGTIIESADPKSGDNAFRQILPFGASAYEFASYNGYLYCTIDSPQGFALYKTTATGNVPYTFTPIFTDGGYKQPVGNRIGISMKVFNGSLYVGGDSVRAVDTILCGLNIACLLGILGNGGAELFRVHADDTWDLIAGTSRQTPAGMKTALSGLGPGFGWLLNQHLWRMEVFNNQLFVGTYDASTELRNEPNGIGAALVPALGFDLWVTSDGVTFTAIDIKGFEDEFNNGVRSLKATPAGLFLGSANPFHGLRIYRAK